MKTYSNRFDPTYTSALKKELSISQLQKTSFPIKPARERDGKVYNRCCRIDFMGLSATSLLDIGCNYIPDNSIPIQFKEVIENVGGLNKDGIFLKVRFLFNYPFSIPLLSLIQAEMTTQRSSTETPAFLRDFRTIAEVDSDTFSSSTTIQNLKNSLEYLQQLMDAPNWANQTANTIRIRFTTIDVNFCLLTINNSLYYDPYLYSKTNRMSKKLSLNSPIVNLTIEKDEDSFKHFEDHFRYIWDLDTTLVCDDATFYKANVPNTLRRLKQPNQVSYDMKAERIKKQRMEQSSIQSTEEEIRNWKFRVRYLLRQYASNTKPVPQVESVFIACSWKEGKDGVYSPNEYAKSLSEWLDNDFGARQPNPYLVTQIIQAPPGGSLTNEIYPHLRDATMGIVILTADIKAENGHHYTKPNVYHELGFLMSQVETNRILILKEDGAHVPSNISDIVHVDFSPQKLALCYRDIADWVHKNCYLVNNQQIINALSFHLDRLKNMIINGTLEQGQGEVAINRISNTIKSIN